MKLAITRKVKKAATVPTKRVRKDGVIRARVESDLKQSVEIVFNRLGLTPTQAITLFYKQVEMNQGIPFEIKIPNEETLKALDDAVNGKNLTRYKSVDDMFKTTLC